MTLASRGDSGRCIKGSVSACGTVVLVPSRLLCDPVRGGRDDEGEMRNAGEGASRAGSGVKGRILPLLDVLAGSDSEG
jgi:hypothetical protein